MTICKRFSVVVGCLLSSAFGAAGLRAQDHVVYTGGAGAGEEWASKLGGPECRLGAAAASVAAAAAAVSASAAAC